MRTRLIGFALLSFALACGSQAPPRMAREENCARTLTTDSLLSFCRPADLAPLGTSHFWVPRGERAANRYAISLRLIPATRLADNSPWPPSFLRDTSLGCADCLDVRDFQVHFDKVGEQTVRVETALVSGGLAGVRDRPSLRAYWPTPEGDWVFIQGWAPSRAGVESLRALIGSVRVERRPGAAF